MSFYQNIFELIDMRSFSNLWFWIALAVMWSSASHWIVGVPFDLVQRARRHGGQAEQDLDNLAHIHSNRLLYIARVSGLWVLGLVCFVLTVLMIMGFFYGLEIAQALFLLGLPMSIVALLSLSTARLIELEDARGEVLRQRLTRQRLYVQLVGGRVDLCDRPMGDVQNLALGVL